MKLSKRFNRIVWKYMFYVRILSSKHIFQSFKEDTSDFPFNSNFWHWHTCGATYVLLYFCYSQCSFPWETKARDGWWFLSHSHFVSNFNYVWNSSNIRFIRILSNFPNAVMLVLLSSSQSSNSKYFPFWRMQPWAMAFLRCRKSAIGLEHLSHCVQRMHSPVK